MECNVNIRCKISVTVKRIITTHSFEKRIGCVIPFIDANVIAVVIIA